MSAATSWVYQAPYRSASHPDQCYYRTDGSGFYEMLISGGSADTPDLKVFRWAARTYADITISVGKASLEVQLDRPALIALRDALNDVLQDGDAIEADRERRESFEAIQEELNQLEDGQQPSCIYCHPDVHYVHPNQVAAKARELEAAGVQRYMVMADPTIVDAELTNDQSPAPAVGTVAHSDRGQAASMGMGLEA